MSYRDCLACKEAGTKPKRGLGIAVVYDPRYQRHGTPTMTETAGWGELTAPGIARLVYEHGINAVVEEYQHSSEVCLVACWWAGLYGPRRLKKAFGAWAEKAGWHLWYGCIRIPDPPTAPGAAGGQG